MSLSEIAGDEPDFIVARRLTAMAAELFATDAWTMPVGLDADHHDLILTMHEVGLVEMTIDMVDGRQVVLWRLVE